MAINKRKVQEVNAGSMADISFLLLIFFLVATTMNSDMGIARVLPQWQEEETPSEVKERNVLNVFVNARNELMVNMERAELSEVKDRVKEFVLNRANDPSLPESKMEQIDLIGEYPVSSGIVSLKNDRATSYGMYIRVQNELVKAFNELRDETARQYFRRSYGDLPKEQMDAVNKAVPLKISEAEERNVEGGK